MSKDWRSKPSIFIRGLIKFISMTGYTYARVPFSAPRECNICGYSGTFRHSGLYFIRPDALCKSCWSTDRERLFALYLESSKWNSGGKAILHFAPESKIVKLLKPSAARYVTADLFTKAVDVNWDIENIPADSMSFDAVVCSHVLEHVDTEKALGEISRILKIGGKSFIMVPINEALAKTYVNERMTTEDQHYLHFHQRDHARILGRDFKDQILAAGFTLDEFSADGSDVVRYGLLMGEKVFIATRSKRK